MNNTYVTDDKLNPKLTSVLTSCGANASVYDYHLKSKVNELTVDVKVVVIEVRPSGASPHLMVTETATDEVMKAISAYSALTVLPFK